MASTLEIKRSLQGLASFPDGKASGGLFCSFPCSGQAGASVIEASSWESLQKPTFSSVPVVEDCSFVHPFNIRPLSIHHPSTIYLSSIHPSIIIHPSIHPFFPSIHHSFIFHPFIHPSPIHPSSIHPPIIHHPSNHHLFIHSYLYLTHSY